MLKFSDAEIEDLTEKLKDQGIYYKYRYTPRLWFLWDLLTESVARSVIATATETEVYITHFYHDTQ